MTKVLRIETTGDVIRCGNGPGLITMATTAFDGDVDIIRCRAPQLAVLAEHVTFVGAVDDWGLAKLLPINMKGWALYGGSPIFGPMYLADDAGRELHETVINMVSAPIETWVPPETLTAMREILTNDYPEAIRD